MTKVGLPFKTLANLFENGKEKFLDTFRKLAGFTREGKKSLAASGFS